MNGGIRCLVPILKLLCSGGFAWPVRVGPHSRLAQSSCLFIALCFSGVSAPAQNAKLADEAAKASDDYFTPLLHSGRIRAAACVIIDHDSSVVRLYGPVTQNTLWRVASVSKVFTAIAVMQLVEQGKIQLDGDVNLYLNGIQVQEPFSRPVTIRQLLMHRSGLDDWFVGDGFRAGTQPAISDIMRRKTLRAIYPPDKIEFYSNYGYGLLGAVIESVTGQRFENYVQAHVLRQLGMLDSTFAQPLPQPSLVAPGRWFYQRASPASALSSDVKDMSLFLQSVLQENRSLLSQSSFREMTTRPAAEIRLQHQLGYWSGNDRGHHLIGASGDSGGFHSVLMAFPDEKVGYFTLVSGGGNAVAWDFYERFATLTFGSANPPAASPQAELKMSRTELSRFTGLYRTVRYPHHDLSKTFILMDLTRVSLDKSGGLEIYGARWLPITPLVFRKENGTDEVSFQTNEAGEVQFFNDSQERISWYETGYAAIIAYLIFLIMFTLGAIRGRSVMRVVSAIALLHCVGWLAFCVATGPSNLIFGLPVLLKLLLYIGTLSPLLALAALLATWQRKERLNYVLSLLLLGYVPFVWYWNLRM